MSVEDDIERERRDELVVAGVATTEPEAAVACGLLRTAGIWCASRVTNFGAGASVGLSVGGRTRSSSGGRTSSRLVSFCGRGLTPLAGRAGADRCRRSPQCVFRCLDRGRPSPPRPRLLPRLLGKLTRVILKPALRPFPPGCARGCRGAARAPRRSRAGWRSPRWPGRCRPRAVRWRSSPSRAWRKNRIVIALKASRQCESIITVPELAWSSSGSTPQAGRGRRVRAVEGRPREPVDVGDRQAEEPDAVHVDDLPPRPEPVRRGQRLDHRGPQEQAEREERGLLDDPEGAVLEHRVVDRGQQPHDRGQGPQREGDQRVLDPLERRRHRSGRCCEQRGGHPEQEQERRHGADEGVLEHVGGEEPLLGDASERRADGREDQREAGVEGDLAQPRDPAEAPREAPVERPRR